MACSSPLAIQSTHRNSKTYTNFNYCGIVEIRLRLPRVMKMTLFWHAVLYSSLSLSTPLSGALEWENKIVDIFARRISYELGGIVGPYI